MFVRCCEQLLGNEDETCDVDALLDDALYL